MGGASRPFHIWAVSSAVERLAYTEMAGGSIPSPPIPAALRSRFFATVFAISVFTGRGAKMNCVRRLTLTS
jgi:hypothetical protein